MCEPITIALIAGTAATAGLQAAGQIQAGRAAGAQADFRAEVARTNAMVAGVRAEDALDRGGIEETRFRRQVDNLKGRQRAAFASNGILLGEGSALTVLEDTAMLGELDALTIRSNAEREATGFLTRRNQFLAQSALFNATADESRRAGRIGALTSIAGGILQAGSIGAGSLRAKGPKVPIMGEKFGSNFRDPFSAAFV